MSAAPLKIGMVGYSVGNGHPFSFSAIFNGYDGTALRGAGWDVIADYLDQQDPMDIGIVDARVTACHAPDAGIAADIARAAHVPAVMAPADMLGEVDAVVIARDDWQSHAPLAMPFLEAGLPVFVDKPLTLDRRELEAFLPYLERGLLMSGSALRYARELDALRARPERIGTLQAVTGAVVLDFPRYGIHLLEAAVGVTDRVPHLVHASRIGGSEVAVLQDEAGVCYQLVAMGQTAKRFRLDFHGDSGSVEVDIADNFSAFRRAMGHFVAQVRSGKPAIEPQQTVALMHVLIGAQETFGGR